MKVKYDVEIPHATRGPAPFAKVFWEFYNSEHKNVGIELEDTQKAIRCQKVILMLTSRNQIHDVVVSRQGNMLYVLRSNADDN